MRPLSRIEAGLRPVAGLSRMWLNFGFDPFRVGSAQVVFGLEIEPEFSGILEEAGESERSIGRDATPSLDDVGYPAVRNFQRLREGVLRESVVGEEVFLDHLTRVDWGNGVDFWLHN